MNMHYPCDNFYRRIQLPDLRGRNGDIINLLDCWCSWKIPPGCFLFCYCWCFCDLYAYKLYRFIILAFSLLKEFRTLYAFKLINLASHYTCISMTLYGHVYVHSIKKLSCASLNYGDNTYLWQPVTSNSYSKPSQLYSSQTLPFPLLTLSR